MQETARHSTTPSSAVPLSAVPLSAVPLYAVFLSAVFLSDAPRPHAPLATTCGTPHWTPGQTSAQAPKRR